MSNKILPYTILGIETSCDETGAAVYTTNDGMLSNVLFSQIELHKRNGGVIPEIASRSHLEKMSFIVQQALDNANRSLQDIDVIAVTHKPGLAGSLLIGTCFAKAIAWGANKKIIGINHLEGHAFSACIENDIPFPFLCMTASGGHTALYIVHDFGQYEVIGETVDDAAGEAFDKIAKLIDLPYPGGPVIEKLAKEVDFYDFYHYTRGNKKLLNFSFSGLKTAVLYDLINRGWYDLATKQFTPPEGEKELIQKRVASSLLICITDIIENKIDNALKQHPELKAVSFVGGVACNRYIRQRLALTCSRKKIPLYHPSPQFCTDNAGMIAFVGHYKAQNNLFSDFYLDILK